MIASDLIKKLTQKTFRLSGTKVFSVQRHRQSGKKEGGEGQKNQIFFICIVAAPVNSYQKLTLHTSTEKDDLGPKALKTCLVH